ncbi:MAG TPA: UDP-N-acetylglucosamine--N-acetylmuramyl-(pentapeptide) pyrophosphoryl-undecaprenol N-acetylglucosamine transferase, partial [Tepidisphaeraceae bacterium]|nr:UDP-N-acetylglucosamine--N-acetylmuramyl-(pentapeptide) pyrophosphoryl-undecaprenol N-acetylglucosamine transferase [Tepidisphaeraceae bacterium]
VKKVLRERKPAAVLGLGGYAAGVAVRMASEKNIASAILNPDVIPGKANQYLIRHVRAVCCQFEETRSHVAANQQDKLKITGCPIRLEMQDLQTHEQAARKLGLDPILKTLVITGASQGAATVNEGVLELMPSLRLTGWQVLHLSGKDHAESVRQGYREANIPALVVDFTPAMQDVWAVANLCISRAGASTCAELTACGVPSILMPYPFHKDMHQRANAKVLEDHGAAVMVDDAKNRKENAAKLRPAVEPLLHDATKRHTMSTAARALGRRDASESVAHVLLDMIADKK